MKYIPAIALFTVIAAMPFSIQAKENAANTDPVEEGMRQAFADYKKGDSEAATTGLRAMIKLIEDKGAVGVAKLLPDQLEDWKGESLKRDDMGILGGGVSISRVYVSKGHKIAVKVIKDSPMVKQLIPLLANEDLIRLSNRKTYRVSTETAIMDGTQKLQLVVDERILVELTTEDEKMETEMVGLVRKLDLKSLAQMK